MYRMKSERLDPSDCSPAADIFLKEEPGEEEEEDEDDDKEDPDDDDEDGDGYSERPSYESGRLEERD